MAEDALARALLALFMAADRPLDVETITQVFNEAADEEEYAQRVTAEAVEAAIQALQARWDGRAGIGLWSIAGGYQLRTAPDLGPLIQRLWPEKRPRLSSAALESLAVIAYRQPCTRSEIEDVRGVDCGGIVRSLLARHLIRIVGKRDEPGRPLLYGTTADFLALFSLPDVTALPTLRALHQMNTEAAAQSAGQPQHRAPDDADDVDDPRGAGAR
jgi:segregation and condensation protein B